MRLTVSDPILCEIGRITVHQSHIEGQMAIFLRELLYLDEIKGNLITSQLSFWELMNMIGALLHNEFGPKNTHVKRFETFQTSMKKIVPLRNKFVHSMWSFGRTLKADSATRSKVVKGTRTFEDVSLNDLQEISKEMEQLHWLLSDIRVTICHYEAGGRAGKN